MVAVSALVYMLLLGSTYSAFGLFVLPVSAEFKLSRADINTALILVSMGSAVMSPFLGRLLDRFSSKRIMMISAVVFGLSLVGLGLSHSLWVNAAVLVVPLAAAFEGLGGNGGGRPQSAQWSVAGVATIAEAMAKANAAV